MVIGLVNRLQRLDKKRVPDIFRSTALEFVAKHVSLYIEISNVFCGWLRKPKIQLLFD